MTPKTYDITIIGGGPTGLFGAFYAGMRGLSTKIVDSLPELGGQLTALYPEKYIFDVGGFPKILAKDLSKDLANQALQFEPEVVLDEEISSLTEEDGVFRLQGASQEHLTRTVLIAGGKGAFEPRHLDCPGYRDLLGKGVEYAVRDPDRYRGQRVLIVGGGDSALDWTLILKDRAASLTLAHRRDGFRAHETSVGQLEKAAEAGEVDLRTFHEVREIRGDGRVAGATLFDNRTDEELDLDIDAVLTFLGFKPDLGPMKTWGLELEKNRILVDRVMGTNIPGVYAAGDIVAYEGKLDLIATGFCRSVRRREQRGASRRPVRASESGSLDQPRGLQEQIGDAPRDMTERKKETVVIIGSGPAAWTAAIYAARADLDPIVYEGEPTRVMIPGGQLMYTTEVENYPGFPDGVTGPEMMDGFKKQALRFGTRTVMENIASVDLSQRPFVLKPSYSEAIEAETVIVATGARANWLGLENEERLAQSGGGVSACAVCDGALPAFREKVLAVVGGGDSAMEEALYLTKFASKVFVIHRRDELRASKIMADRLLENEKAEVLWNSRVVEVLGDEFVTGVRLEDTVSGEQRDVEVGGLFVAIGHTPNTAFLDGQLELDDAGYILTKDSWRTNTSVEGVFAAGDVMDSYYRQAVTAAGTGCMAALEAERWLAHHAVGALTG